MNLRKKKLFSPMLAYVIWIEILVEKKWWIFTCPCPCPPLLRRHPSRIVEAYFQSQLGVFFVDGGVPVRWVVHNSCAGSDPLQPFEAVFEAVRSLEAVGRLGACSFAVQSAAAALDWRHWTEAGTFGLPCAAGDWGFRIGASAVVEGVPFFKKRGKRKK